MSRDGDAVVELPLSTPAQTASWHALMDLHEAVGAGWTLIGGQMVHLHCAERGRPPERATTDADTVVDVRAEPGMLGGFTTALLDLGFRPLTSGDGLQHRWCRGLAQVDVLLPDGIGERAGARHGAGGAPTLQAPGGTQALHRTETVRVHLDGRTGAVPRPRLLGALVLKAAAHAGARDAAVGRHRRDFVVLAGLAGRHDLAEGMSRSDRRWLRAMVAACLDDPAAMRIDGAGPALERLVRGAGST